MKTVSVDSQQSLVQWVSQATGINTFGVKVRLQGNDLHILCEGKECPQRWRTLRDLLQALQYTDLEALTKSHEQPSIYQIFVYGRSKEQKRPEWCHRVYLNQLDRHLEEVNQALFVTTGADKNFGGALILSNESLARKGNPDAIARYLSETLSTLGVAVQVKVKNQNSLDGDPTDRDRLLILCESTYSPDASLLAEPVAEKLRSLKLPGYKDAVIVSKVQGETKPDWMLRVDLTPRDAMLKEWARWGDVQAISRLCNEALEDSKIAVQASLKESTLHLFCTPAYDPLKVAPAPNQELCLKTIVPKLEAIAPQGILSAMVYGNRSEGDQPSWVDWVNLPASDHLALATTALELASIGDSEALHFLIERLLNPDLDWRLATGGVRVQLRCFDDLLHVMCDAPVCPSRKKVPQQVTQFIKQLKIQGIDGVRIYGRSSGQKEPAWNYSSDWKPRPQLVPEPTPEFAASAAYVSELLPSVSSEPIFRTELTGEQVQSIVTSFALDWVATFRKFLVGTQVFVEKGAKPETGDRQAVKVALIWSTLGLILTLQSDWLLGRTIGRAPENPPSIASGLSQSDSSAESQSQESAANTDTSESKQNEGDSVFNSDAFTQPTEQQKKNSNTGSSRSNGTAAAILLAARSHIPTFNARQLDEQLALYKQRLIARGKAPDILIIGSSRALRGIDPVALAKALKTQGYPELDVFNFGINGATAQVVDFIIRKALEPSELPRQIVWADGSRAFNSGREDMTFQSIAASPGYKHAIQIAMQRGVEDTTQSPGEKTENKTTTVNSYQAINQWLNDRFASASATYQNRDRVKAFINEKLQSLPGVGSIAGNGVANASDTDAEEDSSLQAVDFDGFLPLSIRFNPITYYQKHPKVAGSFDNDYKSFRLEGLQDAALNDLLKFTNARQIPVIFVNMPLTGEYLDPIRTKYEQEFEQYMLGLATSSNFIYRDLSQLFPKANNYFSDPSHLNRYGAYEVSKKLANDPMIPWPAK